MNQINWWLRYLLKIASTAEVTLLTEQCMGKDLEGAAAIYHCINVTCRSQWSRGLSSRSVAARLLGMWVRIPPGTWVCRECCVLTGRGLCDKLITRAEESYRLWCVAVCDLETSWMRRPQPALGHTLCLSYKNSQLMLYREIIVVCSKTRTKHIIILCGQNVEFFSTDLVVHKVTAWLLMLDVWWKTGYNDVTYTKRNDEA
jgi:hypothetical protein